jgi:hypothetical protein
VCVPEFNTFRSVKTLLRISIALPAERLRFAARFFCQGSSLRSDERQLRGLDSAGGEAPGTARKSICFSCTAPRCLGSKNKNPSKEFQMQPITKHSLFSLGQVVATPGALTALQKAGQQPQEFLARHLQGDWGDLCEEDRQENALSLDRGFRLLSRYNTSAGEALYVITEADRSVTTILLPEEY